MAGLHVIGFSHTSVLQRLATETLAVSTLPYQPDLSALSPNTVLGLVQSITNPSNAEAARDIAWNYYSRHNAVKSYRDLYKLILSDR